MMTNHCWHYAVEKKCQLTVASKNNVLTAN